MVAKTEFFNAALDGGAKGLEDRTPAECCTTVGHIRTSELPAQQIKKLCSQFKEFVLKRNIPECKRIIHDNAKEAIVFGVRVEVIFNVAFIVSGEDEGVRVRSSIKKTR